MVRERVRSELRPVGHSASQQSSDNGKTWINIGNYPLVALEDQKTLDESHSKFWTRRNVGRFNVGGEFTSTKRWVSTSYGPDNQIARLDWPALKGIYQVTGPRVPQSLFNIASSYASYPAAPTANDMNLWGTAGVNRTIPTSPIWNAAQFIGELHEGLPKIPLKGLAEVSSRGVGSEYLNYQFGIQPFLSDGSTALAAWKGANDRIKWLTRHSGERIRRRVSILEESQTTSTESTDTLYPIFPPTWPGATVLNATPLKTTITSSRSVWFSGCYSYYFKPAPDSFHRGTQKARLIYGLDPSISTVWELLPYSWLVDWHANVGQVMENMSRFASDGLVMRWGYTMCHQLVKKEMSWRGGSITFFTERKTRRYGNPFGYATDIGSYTSRQWAILGALGISRGPNIRF
jgi:hypothetical protein